MSSETAERLKSHLLYPICTPVQLLCKATQVSQSSPAQHCHQIPQELSLQHSDLLSQSFCIPQIKIEIGKWSPEWENLKTLNHFSVDGEN